MTAATRFAAQYIRMSTDKQDLSPDIQKEAIAAYAAAREIEIVATYEDDGRSGIYLKNRPALQKLLQDVANQKQFSVVLVYDVSRWGRFQDTDAAAYYEYHCRLNGADVIYVAELFGAEVNPITAMLKSMKRAMAAEYSRDLAVKSRAGQHYAVSCGHQMGPLPPLGYRRSSVSADGQRRAMLEPGQRKLASTDRVEWVLGPLDEVQLVARICDLYARDGLTFTAMARLAALEGWRDHQGRQLNNRSLATLLKNEALIGNFVWGRRTLKKSLTTCPQSRNEGCVPRLIDDATWERIQARIRLESKSRLRPEEMIERLRNAFRRSPCFTTRDLGTLGLPGRRAIRACLGPRAEWLRAVGQDPAELSKAHYELARRRQAHVREFGAALSMRLMESGCPNVFDGRHFCLDLPAIRLRLQLLWTKSPEPCRSWHLRLDRIRRDVDFDVLVRMEDWYRPLDFFVAPPADVAVRFPRSLPEQMPPRLARYWCQSSQHLLERIKAILLMASSPTRRAHFGARTQTSHSLTTAAPSVRQFALGSRQ